MEAELKRIAELLQLGVEQAIEEFEEKQKEEQKTEGELENLFPT